MDKEGFVLEAQPCFNKFFQQSNNALTDDVTRAASLEDVIKIIEIDEEDNTATEVSKELDKKPCEVQVGVTGSKSSFIPMKNPYITPLKATGVKSPASASATPLSLHDIVVEATNDPLFVETHSSEARKMTPLPILAIAQHVVQATEMWFPTNTTELVIPVHRISDEPLNPHYHSVVGQSLFLVNWQSQFPGLAIPVQATLATEN